MFPCVQLTQWHFSEWFCLHELKYWMEEHFDLHEVMWSPVHVAAAVEISHILSQSHHRLCFRQVAERPDKRRSLEWKSAVYVLSLKKAVRTKELAALMWLRWIFWKLLEIRFALLHQVLEICWQQFNPEFLLLLTSAPEAPLEDLHEQKHQRRFNCVSERLSVRVFVSFMFNLKVELVFTSLYAVGCVACKPVNSLCVFGCFLSKTYGNKIQQNHKTDQNRTKRFHLNWIDFLQKVQTSKNDNIFFWSELRQIKILK